MEPVNQRRRFLSQLSTLSLITLFPFSKKIAGIKTMTEIPEACMLIPPETRGPFPLFETTDISSQSALIRSDIRETQSGVPMKLTITVQNLNCLPIQGAKVHIWHCNKDGLYSGYSTPLNPGQAGLTYLRGIQVTDRAGQVKFNTIYPGWYSGRLTHIHAEVFIDNVLLHTSQFAFPLETEAGSATALVNAFYGRTDINVVTSYFADAIFQDGYDQQLLDFAGDITTGYTANHTFIVDYTVAPLRIIYFTAGTENKHPVLWWLTGNEVHLGHFEIEQSMQPSKGFQSIGTVNAVNGTGVNNYTFNLPRNLPAGITYFRLKVFSKEGVSYSAVVTLLTHVPETLQLMNSFVTDQLVIKHPSVYSNNTVKVVNMGGQLMATGKLKKGAMLTTINVQQLPDGIYLLIIESGIDRFVTKFYKGD